MSIKAPPLAIAVELSATSKLGPVHATYASQNSCPASCGFRNNGCYAESGPTGIHTKRLNRGQPDATALAVAEAEAFAITDTLSGRLDLRIHVVGDCSSSKAASLVSEAALKVLKPNRQAWSYTHAWRDTDRAAWSDVSILASGEKPAHAIEAMDRGWATALVVPSFASESMYKADGLKILPCVQQTRGVQCVDCRLCMNAERLLSKGLTIGFTPHGASKKRVLAVIQA